jgi:hypothetical protein
VSGHVECPQPGPVAEGYLGQYSTFTNASFDINETLGITVRAPPPPSRWPGGMRTPTALFFFVICPLATVVLIYWIIADRLGWEE